MKTSKLFTIDVEIAERLKNTNASLLVNGLLKEYFELRSDKNTLKEEKKAVLSSILKKKSNFLRRLKSSLNGIYLKLIGIQENGSELEAEHSPLKKVLKKNILKKIIRMLKKVLSSTKNTGRS